MNKYIKVVGIIFVFFIFFYVVTYFYFESKSISHYDNVPSSSSYKSIFDGISYIINVDINSGIDYTFTNKADLYWPISNKSLVSVVSSSGVNFSSPQCSSFDPNKIKSDVDSFLKSDNFEKVDAWVLPVPSSEIKDFRSWYKNKKSNVMCSFDLRSSCDKYVNISAQFICNSVANFNKAFSEQNDILLHFVSEGEYVHSISIYGNYYGFSVNSLNDGGYFIIAKKLQNGWQEIYSGQGEIPCDTAKKFNVPHQLDYAQKCLDYSSSNYNIINNPN